MSLRGPADTTNVDRPLTAVTGHPEVLREPEASALPREEPLEIAPPAIADAPTYDLQRERRRIRALGAIAVLTALGCIAAWTWHLSGRDDPLAPPAAKLSETLSLHETKSVGPLLYAVVNRRSWEALSDEQRLGSVLALGLGAANAGFEAVYLVDGRRGDLAAWTAEGGAELKTDAPR